MDLKGFDSFLEQYQKSNPLEAKPRNIDPGEDVARRPMPRVVEAPEGTVQNVDRPLPRTVGGDSGASTQKKYNNFDEFLQAYQNGEDVLGQKQEQQLPASVYLGSPEDESVIEALTSGLSSGYYGSASAIGTLIGADEFANRMAEQAAIRAPRTQRTDVEGVKSAAKYVAGLVGQSIPEMIAVTGAMIGGTLASGPVGGLAAAYTVSVPFHAGRNLQRQEQETGEENYGTAFVGALAQGGLDVVVPGRVGSMFASRVAGIAERSLTQAATRMGKEIGKDVVTESATETLQQAIEIGQADPDLLRVLINPQTPEEMGRSDQLLTELIDSAVGGAAAGGAVSAVGHVASNSLAKGETSGEKDEAPDFGKITEVDIGTDEGVKLLAPPKTGESAETGPNPENQVENPAKTLGKSPETASETVTLPLPEVAPTEAEVTLTQSTPQSNIDTVETNVNENANAVDATVINPKEVGEAFVAENTFAKDVLKINNIPLEQIGKSSRLQFLFTEANNLYSRIKGNLHFLSDIEKTQLGNVIDLFYHVRNLGADPEISRIAFQTYEKYFQRYGSQRQLNDFTTKLSDFLSSYETLKSEMDKVGLGRLSLVIGGIKYPDSLGHFSHFTKEIAITPNLLEEGVSIGHEIIHALKSLGVFDTPKGKKIWKLLSDFVNSPYNAGMHWASPSKSMETEEKIAELYGQYNNIRNSAIKARKLNLPSIVKEALFVVRRGYNVVIEWAKNHEKIQNDFESLITPWDALEYIASGKIKNETIKAIGGQTFTQVYRTSSQVVNLSRKLNIPEESHRKIVKVKQHADYFNFMVKWGWNLEQLAKKNPHIQFLQEYLQQATRWYTAKTAWLSRANETVGMWNNLPPDQQKALATMFFDMEQMGYRTPDEVKKGIVRKPTKAEWIAKAKSLGLTQQAVDVYIKVNKDFGATLDKLEELAKRNIQRSMPNDQFGALLKMADVEKEFRNIRKRPYFPHTRFGEYTVVVKNSKGNTIYFESFETKLNRKRALASINKMFPNDTVTQGFLDKEHSTFQGLPHSVLEAIKDNLNLDQKQKAVLEDLLIQMSPTQSFKNHFVRRQNTPGYSKDALRAYADYFMHAANHMSRLEYGPLMQDAITNGERDVSNSRKTKPGADLTKRDQMLQYLRHHLDQILNPKPDWAAARSFGFLFWLGFNVKSALVNLTQVPMVTAPYLGANFGDAQTISALTGTYTDLKNMYRNPDKAMAGMKPEDAKLIDLGIKGGVLDESFAQHLGAIAEGANLLKTKSGTAFYKMAVQFNAAAGYMFQTMEKFNRRVTFMTAVKLARKNPNATHVKTVVSRFGMFYQDLIQNEGLSPTEAAAYLVGKDAVDSTQFNYSAYQRPRIMEGRKSVFLTFFMFTQNMLWFIQNSPGRTRYLLTLFAAAGLMGLPGAEDAEDIAKWVGRSIFGQDWDPQKEVREMMVSHFDTDPDWILHGASRFGFGLEQIGDATGLPIPSFDLSGSLGMGSPLPIVSPAIRAATRPGGLDEKLGQFTMEGAGATLGTGIGFLKALSDQQLPWTDLKRWEPAMPASASSVSKAFRKWTEGKERRRDNSVLVDYDRNNPEHMAELVGQAMGFRITREAKAWDKAIMLAETEGFWKSRRGILLKQYNFARINGDKQDVQEVIQAIKRFNLQSPYNGLRISRETLTRSSKQTDIGIAKREADIPRSKMMTEVYRDIIRLFPEDEINISKEPAPK